MPVIEKKSRQGISGEIIIKFSLRHKRFEIEFTDKTIDLTKVDRNLFYFESYEKIEQILDRIQQQYLSKHQLEKKQIVVSFKSSQSPDPDKENGIRFNEGEKMPYGSGFALQWWVVEKYIPIDQRYGKLELFTVIEKSFNSADHIRQRPNIFGQIFHSEPVRVLEYSDELYNFLKGMDVKIAGLCDQLYSFFDKDETKFLDNIKNQQLLLK